MARESDSGRHCRAIFGRAALFVAVLLSTSSVTHAELEIREVLWGFDGQVRPHRFNPVSIQIDNGSSTNS